MAATQITDEEYDCPNCGGRLRLEYRSWGCVDCGHVPNHGAD